MVALGALALFGCVRRLWPDDREAGFVALVLYAGSAQVLFAGMTSYAMPGHLALNLCWLWLFLRRDTLSDLAALAVGFVATGLHQPLMHPMFVGPFILLLLAQRHWPRAAIYIAGYAVIGAFWLWWPTFISSLVQVSAQAPRPEGTDYVTRLMGILRDRDPMGMPNMVANGLRFIAWQHLLLVPLLLAGARRYRTDPMIAALAWGMVLTLLVMAILLPYQGHGFGYRYLRPDRQRRAARDLRLEDAGQRNRAVAHAAAAHDGGWRAGDPADAGRDGASILCGFSASIRTPCHR